MADFAIDYNGVWYHEGVRIQRDAIARLFSDRALVLDGEGHYWLQTPFEKYAVDVTDVPYIIVDYSLQAGDVDLITNMGEVVALGPEHPLELRLDRLSGAMLPYVEVRNGLYARLGRSVYYALVHNYGPQLSSRGEHYALGLMND